MERQSEQETRSSEKTCELPWDPKGPMSLRPRCPHLTASPQLSAGSRRTEHTLHPGFLAAETWSKANTVLGAPCDAVRAQVRLGASRAPLPWPSTQLGADDQLVSGPPCSSKLGLLALTPGSPPWVRVAAELPCVSIRKKMSEQCLPRAHTLPACGSRGLLFPCTPAGNVLAWEVTVGWGRAYAWQMPPSVPGGGAVII